MIDYGGDRMNVYWISVDKVLPKYPGLYLVLEGGIPFVKRWDGIGWREHYPLTHDEDADITYWMPIPARIPTIGNK